ncbi:MAG: proline dehydrogenase family protein [Microscillaceae bacterium]|jgi:proline dehydrogenase|nr:proline dehydrogenase family protein [Microscillaceae bacterium]
MNQIEAKVSFEDTSIAFSSRSDMELQKMYWMFAAVHQNWMVWVGTNAIKYSFQMGLPIKWAVKNTIFNHFCGGETIEDCKTTIQKLADFGIGTILDYSVEGEKTERGFDMTAQEIMRTIDKAATNPQNVPFSVFKVTGVAPFDLLAKVQSGDKLTASENETWQKAQKRVDMICQRAHERKVRLFIDAEETWIQKTIDNLAYTMMAKYNREQAIVYNTYQMYCVASLQNLKDAYHQATMHNHYLGVKMVRGAYMEKERARAAEMNYPDPIQPNKEATDNDFNDGLKFCVDNQQRIALCAGTHNEYSSYYLTVLMEKYNIAPNNPNFYFAQLYGMSDHISYNLANAGYNVAKYVPYGPVKAVLPYLFRRASENTSVAGQSGREFTLIKNEIKRRRQSKKS